MGQGFNSILVSVLEEYETNSNMDIEQFINSISKDYDLSIDDIEKIKETNGLLDLFAEKAASLDIAKKEGYSRKYWMLKEFDNITEGRSEREKAQLATALSNVTENMYNNELTSENE